MINPVGYLKLWRELFNKPIWINSTPEQKTILVTLLAMANFKPKQWEWKGKKFKVKEGQFITSLESILKNCGKNISIRNIRTSLDRFRKLDFLTYESTKTGRLITIINWYIYQQEDIETDKVTDKDLTKTRQTGDKQVTTREEVKKDKKDKKSTYMFFDNVELNNTFLSFIDYRISVKAKMTDRAIELMIAKLKKECASDGERIETLNNSILNGWKGIFPKSDTKYPQKKSIKDNFDQREYTEEVLESLYKNSD